LMCNIVSCRLEIDCAKCLGQDAVSATP
jgi:hypothetical protein